MPALPFDRTLFDTSRDELPAWLEVLLVVLLAAQAARLLWIAFAMPIGPIGTDARGPGGGTDGEAGVATAAPAAGQTSTSLLAHGDLFFRQASTEVADALGYRLFGVRVDGDRSSAILGHDGQQRAYIVGDRIASGLILDAVFADHAVLRAGGRRHRVDLPDGSQLSASQAGPPVAGTLPVGQPAKQGPVAAVAEVDPQQLLASAGLRARSDGGEVTGYTLVPRGNEALLRKAGLQPGDVLLSVNGQPLDPERLGELKEELEGRSQATITFQRDGRTRSVTLKAKP